MYLIFCISNLFQVIGLTSTLLRTFSSGYFHFTFDEQQTTIASISPIGLLLFTCLGKLVIINDSMIKKVMQELML